MTFGFFYFSLSGWVHHKFTQNKDKKIENSYVMQYSSKQSLYVKKHYIREKLGLTGSRSQSKNIILLVLGGDTVTATTSN